MDIKRVFELKQQLNAFLNEHPELKPLQAKIDQVLAGAGSQANRNVLLHNMMKKSTNDLGTALTTLASDVSRLHQLIKTIDKK